MRAIISAGGTGGHIYPALAIINKIKEKEPKSEFLYIGTHNRMEKDIIPKHNIPFETIEIYGFNRKKIFQNFKTISSFIKSYKQCKITIKKFNPDVVIGVGGYVTGPVIYAAHKLGYKTIIHEQNSIPGKCNKFLSNYVNKIVVSFKSSMELFPINKTIFTGNPCSEAAINTKETDKREIGLSINKKLVYIVMGSLGSAKVNEVLIKTMSLFNNKEYEVLFITGKDSYEVIKKNKFPKNVKILPYIDNQIRIMKQASIVVSRCGATTLSEIIALKIPSILIPSPYVTDNHQYKNGLDLIKNDAAIMIEEKDLKGDLLVRTIDKLINDEIKIKAMKSNLDALYISSSATLIYNEINSLVDGK
ncbi:MAG: undecaprenyldiphospho-muramoylpentapeptide beta-N-acetylglucosaminyltransferase [Bacilli bacterium]